VEDFTQRSKDRKATTLPLGVFAETNAMATDSLVENFTQRSKDRKTTTLLLCLLESLRETNAMATDSLVENFT